MKKWIIIVCSFSFFPSLGSHIVGGEFELLHVDRLQYRLNMILYFDKINGSKGAFDTFADVNFFKSRDSTWMQTVRLFFHDSTDVLYTQPKCDNGQLWTKKLVYTALITLSPDNYSDAMGYYITWQRCCRNYRNIVNIFSDNPDTDTDGNLQYAGQTFYLQFPPVFKNGTPFINSSPHLFPPLSDYAVVGAPYYVDFRGVDDDSDSLVYSMITPLSTTEAAPLPVLSPGPYPDIQWRPGYGINRITGGHPDMTISTDGLLTLTAPNVLGLYVFAVRVEQYRNHEKIGETRRDFQMLVIDAPVGHPPVILGKKLTEPTFTHKDFMTVSFDNTVADDNRCIQVNVSDLDSSLPPTHSEFIGIRVVPLNFGKDTNISGILPAVTTDILTNGSTKTFSICFPRCPFINGPFQIGIIAYDDQCALPLTDTLRVTVTVQPPVNSPPFFTTLPVTQTLAEGDSASWIFSASDLDLNDLTAAVVTDGFVLANAGMKFQITKRVPGLIQGKLHWDAYCDIYDFTHRTQFQVRVFVDDNDLCNSDGPVPTSFDLTVQLPPVTDPVISSDLISNPATIKVNESIKFNVTGVQSCCDKITLVGSGVDFDMAAYGASFSQVTGLQHITSPFNWSINCNNVDLTKKSLFQYRFMVIDSNKCRIINNDTLMVLVHVLPPDNTRPNLVVESESPTAVDNNALSITLGEPIVLRLTGTDNDFPLKDTLKLQLLDAVGSPVKPDGYAFRDTTGIANCSSEFKWSPDCSIFKDGVYKNEYDLTFSVSDGRCFNVKGDTIMVHVTIKDIVNQDGTYNPSNIITPDGDGCNDYFAIEGVDPPPPGSKCQDSEDLLGAVPFPLDNCAGRFEVVRIYNRWGEQVFESKDRKFRWYAPNETAGVYYYYIKYGATAYKGPLSVRF